MTSRRWLWLLLLVPVAIGLARLRFDVEVLNLLPDDVPAVRGLRLYQENFANARELIITLRAPDADTAASAARELTEHLHANHHLTRDVTWQPPWLEHPEQAAEFIAWLWLNQPPAAWRDLTNRLAPQNLSATLAATKAALTTSLSPEEIARRGYDPFGLMTLPGAADQASQFGQGNELFASPDGRFRLVFVTPREDLRDYRRAAHWLAELRASVATWQRTHDDGLACAIRYTGHPAFLSEISLSMERDMRHSALGTAAIVALLFWLVHGRFKPLLWLLALLGVVLAATLGLGGLLFGSLNVVSLGFAAILLGLGVDYALVLYQEALASPGKSAAEVRREVAPSIFWAATTTAAAFFVLNWGGLPGLAQLGSLVTLGVILAALIMANAFLPPLLKNGVANGAENAQPSAQVEPPPGRRSATAVPFWFVTVALLILAVVILSPGLPRLDHTAEPLRPIGNEAHAAMLELQQRLERTQEPLFLLVEAQTEAAVASQLTAIQPVLHRAREQGHIADFTLPDTLWPQPALQRSNHIAAQHLASQRSTLHAAARTADFSTNSLRLTDAVLDTWQHAVNQNVIYWPTNTISRWILNKTTARHDGNWLALGLIYPSESSDISWSKQLPPNGLYLTSWDTLGEGLLAVVQRDLWLITIPIVLIITGALWLAFRSAREVALSLGTLVFAFFLLLAAMRLMGWEWNLMNLMAVPLLLGTAEDYSIHMQLALRRHGSPAAARRTTGRALLLCGGTTVAGFGSLAWSSNAGLASLGKVCATGIACACLTAVFLLPAWWTSLVSRTAGEVRRPSSFYRTDVWRLGMWLARNLPQGIVDALARILGTLYWLAARHRRDIVTQNLLPVVKDETAAAHAGRRLFQQFAQKLVDLWRFESGSEPDFGSLHGWENYEAARASGRGVLLLTPHIGNWEFGGPIMTRRGIKLHVITLAEPGGLTELRQASRARWGIETVVIGDNAFAFVEIIKLLQNGATVALLVDRPAPASAVTVELFGQPFPASIAAAELARASGCALVPATIVRGADRYEAVLSPEIAYDRAALGSREARLDLTRQIMRAFEPLIRDHPDQWYHFVPVWTASK
ncbi:MAG: MMPL family transporter [Verrucomicrobiota bacterium]